MLMLTIRMDDKIPISKRCKSSEDYCIGLSSIAIIIPQNSNIAIIK